MILSLLLILQIHPCAALSIGNNCIYLSNKNSQFPNGTYETQTVFYYPRESNPRPLAICYSSIWEQNRGYNPNIIILNAPYCTMLDGKYCSSIRLGYIVNFQNKHKFNVLYILPLNKCYYILFQCIIILYFICFVLYYSFYTVFHIIRAGSKILDGNFYKIFAPCVCISI